MSLPPPLSSAFRPLVERLDYRAVVRQTPVTELDHYWWVRARLVLGEYVEAEICLQDCERLYPQALFTEFLRGQLDLYRRLDLPRSQRELSLLGERLTDPTLKAELDFILGYANLLLDRQRPSIRHHRSAAEQYEQVGLPAHAANCWFNLWVSYQNVNQQRMVEAYAARLEELAKLRPEPAILHLHSRIRAYWHLHREEYEEAEGFLRQALRACEALGRFRDVGGIVCTLAFVLFCYEEEEPFDELMASFRPRLAEFTVPHQLAFTQFRQLRETGVAGAEALPTIERWKRGGLDSPYYFYLLHCLCLRLERTQDYETLLKVSAAASKEVGSQEQAAFVVDFRYFHALALFRTGQPESARRLITAYYEDASEVGAERKMAKGKKLQGGNEPRVSANRLVIDHEADRILFRGRTTQLTRYPISARLLQVLAAVDGAQPIPKVFERVYRQTFSPQRHQARFNALIERTRRLLDGSDAILRYEGTVRIAPWIEVSMEGYAAPADLAPLRRAKLVSVLRKSRRSLGISDLETLFAESRRTLQMDLRHLSKVGMVRSEGNTKSRRYFLGAQS